MAYVMSELIDGQIDGQTDGQIEGLMDRWTDINLSYHIVLVL